MIDHEAAYSAIYSVLSCVVFTAPVGADDLEAVRGVLADALPGFDVAVTMRWTDRLVCVTVHGSDGIRIFCSNLFVMRTP